MRVVWQVILPIMIKRFKYEGNEMQRINRYSTVAVESTCRLSEYKVVDSQITAGCLHVSARCLRITTPFVTSAIVTVLKAEY